MNKLIQKAIEAIQAGKNDYAIGLLEGLLEMQPSPQQTGFMGAVAMARSIPQQAVPMPLNLEMQPSPPPDKGDAVMALERSVEAKLNAVKSMAT